MGSCILKFAPKLPHIAQMEGPLAGDVQLPELAKEEEEEEKTTEHDNDTADQAADVKSPDETVDMFLQLVNRLAWHNPLGLAEPATAADSVTKWTCFKSLELDWGPAKKRRETGTPSLDRIMENLSQNFAQYMHVFLALMMLQALLFRSWFACLPWLVGYQFASMKVPLKTMEKVPQVQLSKIPMKFRVVGTVSLHALVWLFFLYETIWKCGFFTELFSLGLIVLHAHSVKPASVAN